MSFITAIGTATPPNVFSQSQLADFMVQAMQLGDEETKKLYTIFRASGIARRASVLSDYGKKSDFTFYSNNKNFLPFPSTKERNNVYRKFAIDLSVQAVQDALSSRPSFDKKTITHVITVSCTGLYAPGLDIDLINALQLPLHIHRTCINFMGCYAAISALKAATAFCTADSSAKVLIVCTELCSLHFQREPTEDNMLANALFADGAAAVLVEGKSQHHKRIEMKSFKSMLIQNGSEHMAWNVGDFGFEMRLSAYVPDILGKSISEFYAQLLAEHDASIPTVKYLAIHPGGRKILATVEKALGVSKTINGAAYDVLKNFGNMSSPTVLFVLKAIIGQLTRQDHHEKIISFAFGPGLTLEGVLFNIHVE